MDAPQSPVASDVLQAKTQVTFTPPHTANMCKPEEKKAFLELEKLKTSQATNLIAGQVVVTDIDPKFESLPRLSTSEELRTASTNEDIIVMFFAPWCPHCQSMFPVYAKAAEEAPTNKETNIKFITVDGDMNKATTKEYQLPGFPTIKVFLKGVPHTQSAEYSANVRCSDDLLKFIKTCKDAAPTIPATGTGDAAIALAANATAGTRDISAVLVQ